METGYHGPKWVCHHCHAWVGCHKGTTRPLGTLANKELRRLRMMAHEAFDRIWQSGAVSRNRAYRWIAERLGIEQKECHIGAMNEDQCKRVIQLSDEYKQMMGPSYDIGNTIDETNKGHR